MSGKEPASKGEPFVMVPCRLIDEVMPGLKDTELRLLLVVLRQTVGRRNPDGTFKERDWLSHSQLKARTGRAGEAVSSAVDALVRRGLLEVRGESGGLLFGATERRRSRGRLYFAPAPAIRLLIGVVGKPNRTRDKRNELSRPFRKSEPVRDAEAIEREKARIRERLSSIAKS